MADVPSYIDENNIPRLAEPVALVAPDGTFREPGAPSKDQDPIYDHANGVITAVVGAAAAVVLFTPPAGCTFAEVLSDMDIMIRTDNLAPTGASDPLAMPLQANIAKIIPVVPTVAVKAWASVTASVRVMPFKVRS